MSHSGFAYGGDHLRFSHLHADDVRAQLWTLVGWRFVLCRKCRLAWSLTWRASFIWSGAFVRGCFDLDSSTCNFGQQDLVPPLITRKKHIHWWCICCMILEFKKNAQGWCFAWSTARHVMPKLDLIFCMCIARVNWCGRRVFLSPWQHYRWASFIEFVWF